MSHPTPLATIEALVASAKANPAQTAKDLCAHFQLGESTVSRYLRLHGIRLTRKGYPSQYQINETFFSVIDTPVKAQILGLIYADGSMSKHNKGLISIRLAQEDEDYLNQMNKAMGHNKPLYYVRRTFMISPYNGKTYPTQTTCILDITRARMYQDLQRLGVCVNKTRIDLPLPPIPDHLIRWFILGLFEGDGWITNTLKSDGTLFSANWGIALSKSLGEDISFHLDKHLKIGPGALKNIGNVWKLTYASQAIITRIMEWLYEEHTGLRMERKHAKWLETEDLYNKVLLNPRAVARMRHIPALTS